MTDPETVGKRWAEESRLMWGAAWEEAHRQMIDRLAQESEQLWSWIQEGPMPTHATDPAMMARAATPRAVSAPEPLNRHSTAYGLRAIGVDPGPTPGMVLLVYGPGLQLERAEVVQCSAGVAVSMFDALLDFREDHFRPTYVGIETFVVGPRATRSSSPAAGRVTRELVEELKAAAEVMRYPVALRSAVAVKTWATDARLERAGLLEPVKGMRHARDAARSALFAAVHDGHVPDPLSKAFRR
jgi:hypothetical protein